MDTTRGSLLERVRDLRNDAGWQEFYKIYQPLLFGYARARGLRHSDAEDVAQEAMVAIQRRLPDFQYDRSKGRFKGWLRKIVNNQINSRLRRRTPDQLEESVAAKVPDGGRSPDEIWEELWTFEHTKYCLEQIRPEIQPNTFRAFELFALEEKEIDEVCKELEMSRNQIYVAKSRVLSRLRERMAELTQGME